METDQSDITAQLRKFESQFNVILKGTSYLNERTFQLCLTIFMTLILFGLAYMSPISPYSYICAVVVSALFWCTFSKYEQLRSELLVKVSESDPLLFFNHKRSVLQKLLNIRLVSAIQVLFMFLSIWLFKGRERMFAVPGLALLVFSVVFFIILMIYYRGKLLPTLWFLDQLINDLRARS